MHCKYNIILKGVNGDHGTDRKQSTPITDLFAFLIEFYFKFRIIQISTHFFHDDDYDDNSGSSGGIFSMVSFVTQIQKEKNTKKK